MSHPLQQMRELIAEHKPHIDKMNKTGPQLKQLRHDCISRYVFVSSIQFHSNSSLYTF